MLEYCGTEYGGFFVEQDAMSENLNIIYSFGIGEDLSFSEHILKRWNCEVYAFDPTPKSIKYVENHQLYKDDRFHFYDYGLADYDGTMQFHLPVNNEYVSGSAYQYSGVKEETITVAVHTFNYIRQRLNHNRLNILKMDIEGSEFAVIEALKPEEMCFDQICIEFHSRFFDDGKEKLDLALKKLTSNQYSIIAADKEKEEYTFIKQGKIK